MNRIYSEITEIDPYNTLKDKIKELQASGTSIMFVSHSIPAVESFCQKTVWIENSKVMAYGETKEVCAKYLEYCANKQYVSVKPKINAIICTYKREKEVLKNIEKLKLCKEYINHVFVIDNGKTLDTNLSDDFVSILPNRNLGGTGGFTRGLIEATKTDCTHVLLMDDDIDFDPETYKKAYERVASFTKEEKNDWIGFSMSPFDKPYLQYEMGSKWNGMKMMINNHNLDMRIEKNKKKNENHQRYNYSAWWSLIMPISVVKKYGYPFPFFIKFDDIEYGMRRDGELIQFSNDFKVTHESFENKYNCYLEYYLMRNAFITNAIHLKGSKFCSLMRFTWKGIKFIFKGQAGALNMINVGARDYFAGPSLFFEKEKSEYYIERLNSKRAYTIVFFLYLIPGLPKDVISYVGGVSEIKFKPFIILSTIGRLPGMFGSIIFGSLWVNKQYALMIILGVVAVIAFILCIVFRKNISDKLDELYKDKVLYKDSNLNTYTSTL